MHCTVEELRDRISHDEVLSGGWFLMELRKAENGDKQAFKPDPKDLWKLFQTRPELFPTT